MFYYTGIPIITYVTAAACVFNYIRMTQLMKQYSPNDSAVQCGAVFGPYIVENGQYWRLITGGFVHFSIFHLLMNVYVLVSLGGTMEAAFGHILFFILLYGSVLMGNAFSVYMYSDYSISGGMSSGMYGLIAAQLAMILILYGPQAILSSGSLLTVILLNLLMNFLPGVAWKSHLGGACFGVLFITLLYRFAFHL